MIYKALNEWQESELQEWADVEGIQVVTKVEHGHVSYGMLRNAWKQFREWQRDSDNERNDTDEEYEYRRALMNGRLITSDGKDVS